MSKRVCLVDFRGYSRYGGALILGVCIASIASLVCGANPEQDLIYHSKPGTVITNDPVKSYGLTQAEVEMIRDEGLLITEKVSYSSFGSAYYDIYRRDLPVYLTADSILHAVHRSFDSMVMEIETEQLLPRLIIVLDTVIKNISGKVSLSGHEQELWIRTLVARSLLGDRSGGFRASMPWLKSVSSSIAEEVDRRLALLLKYRLDGQRNRDYSQCRPRGHYTRTKALSGYFSAIVYLGIDPLVVWVDKRDELNRDTDIKEELRAAVALAHIIRDDDDTMQAYTAMEHITSAIFGKPNGITVHELLLLEKELITAGKADDMNELQMKIAALVTSARNISIRFRVSPIPTAGQPAGPPVLPPAAFSFCPRRQSFDAFILQSVVNENVRKRWMASHLDVAMVMGSTKARDLLKKEMSMHPGLAEAYKDLGALYDKKANRISDQSSGIAQEWYMAMGELFRERRLGESDHLKALISPAFDTRRLHSFVGGYTEYKHDMVAYSVQANLGGTLCEFPCVYIDPYPRLYKRLACFSLAMAGIFEGEYLDAKRDFYLDSASTFTQLSRIAEKEISGELFTQEEEVFLKNLIDIHWPFGSGTITYSGWYAQLFPDGDPTKQDMLVADIFSTPKQFVPEEFREKVLHVGTGPINLGFFELPGPDGWPLIYVGPVYSVFEKITSNSERLTDESWKEFFSDSSSKSGLMQPRWLDSIIQRTNSNRYVRVGRGVPAILSIPLRLKFTDGEKLVERLKDASTLKGLYYQKESHSIVVSPAGLVCRPSLNHFISQAEKDQVDSAAWRARDTLKSEVAHLSTVAQWKYWSSFPSMFNKELFASIIEGSSEEQIMAFLALRGSEQMWNSGDVVQLSNYVLNGMSSNLV
jgi:hypothetical protein